MCSSSVVRLSWLECDWNMVTGMDWGCRQPRLAMQDSL